MEKKEVKEEKLQVGDIIECWNPLGGSWMEEILSVKGNKATSNKLRVFHTKKWPRAKNLSEVFIHGQRNAVNTYYVLIKPQTNDTI